MIRARCEICGRFILANDYEIENICDDCEIRLLENKPYPYFSE